MAENTASVRLLIGRKDIAKQGTASNILVVTHKLQYEGLKHPGPLIQIENRTR